MPHFIILDYYTISLQISLLLAFFYLFQKSKPYKKTYFLILLILFTGTVLELFATYLANQGIRNLFYYNLVFILFETNLILLYCFLVSEIKKIKRFILISMISFTSWYIINALYFQNIFMEFQTNSYVLGSLLIILFSGRFFYEIFSFQKYPEGNLLAIPHFWIITGIIFFYATSFMFFVSIQIPDINSEFLRSLAPLIRILSMIMYLLMGISFHFPSIFKQEISLTNK